jgi:hypothetical protein
MAEKKDERTLEMRIAELENRLAGGAQQQMEFTEQEVAAYNKIADALGVGIGVEQYGGGGCRLQPPQACRVQACRIQTCRIQPCRVQPCRIQGCRVVNSCRPNQPTQCIFDCVACYPGDYEVDYLSGGFGTLGY